MKDRTTFAIVAIASQGDSALIRCFKLAAQYCRALTAINLIVMPMISLYQARPLAVAACVALACFFPKLAFASSQASWTGVVTYVVDGDTVRVRPPEGGKPVSIRIEGIDAPEICQPGGTVARNVLKRQLLGKRVVIQGKARDGYGRLVARIVLNKEDQGKWLVTQGLAWSYRYRNNTGPYAFEQRQAQEVGIGMFARAFAQAPVYPGEFRKQHGSCYLRYH
jgi:micrococcal nuclease